MDLSSLGEPEGQRSRRFAHRTGPLVKSTSGLLAPPDLLSRVATGVFPESSSMGLPEHALTPTLAHPQARGHLGADKTADPSGGLAGGVWALLLRGGVW